MDWFKDRLDDVRDAAIDAVGFAASAGGACASTVGHGAAGAGLAVADVATLGLVDSIGDARDEHFEEMIDGMGDAKASMAAFTERTDYYRSDPPADDKADWMAGLPDEVPVSELFVPGTHDTMALRGGDLAQCQSWTLSEQLCAGLRAFDIRPKHEDDMLPIFHGIIRMDDDFDGVVAAFEDFLAEHPSEVIFARVKREGECGGHRCDFNDEVTSRFRSPDLWQCACPEWRPLGELRGKIVPLAKGSHLRLYRQPIDVQDVYNTGDEDEKFAIVSEHATKEREPGTLYLSYCSAVGMDGNVCFKAPAPVAYQVNRMVLENLDGFGPGVYLFDFPGNGLVDAVIARNAPG